MTASDSRLGQLVHNADHGLTKSLSGKRIEPKDANSRDRNVFASGMILAMPQESASKAFGLSISEVDDRITLHISTFLAAINKHGDANNSLVRLASSGCDIAALWLVLETYLTSQKTGVLKQRRREAAGTRVGLEAIVKQLRIALGKTFEEREYGLEIAFALEDLGTNLNAWISYLEMHISVAGQLEKSRGRLRPELLLVHAVMYLRSRTGRPCYTEIADILEVLHLAKGRSVDIDPENLRRACERYKSPKNDAELALYKRNIQRYKQHDLAPLLRRELFAKLPEPIYSPDSRDK